MLCKTFCSFGSDTWLFFLCNLSEIQGSLCSVTVTAGFPWGYILQALFPLFVSFYFKMNVYIFFCCRQYSHDDNRRLSPHPDFPDHQVWNTKLVSAVFRLLLPEAHWTTVVLCGVIFVPLHFMKQQIGIKSRPFLIQSHSGSDRIVLGVVSVSLPTFLGFHSVPVHLGRQLSI